MPLSEFWFFPLFSDDAVDVIVCPFSSHKRALWVNQDLGIMVRPFQGPGVDFLLAGAIEIEQVFYSI
jgi:hypothetical protein